MPRMAPQGEELEVELQGDGGGVGEVVFRPHPDRLRHLHGLQLELHVGDELARRQEVPVPATAPQVEDGVLKTLSQPSFFRILK